jgi:hypothetical protein
MLPYFIFAFIGLGAEIIKRFLLHRDSLDWLIEIKGILFYMDMSHLANHYGFVLWFLPTLFLARLILFLLYQITTHWLYIFFISLLLFYLSFYIDLPFAIDNALNVVLWLVMGRIYFIYGQKKHYLEGLPIIALLVIGLLLTALAFGLPQVNIANKIMSNEGFAILWAFAIIYSLILILQLLDKVTLPRLKQPFQWGKETLFLFIIHPYTNNIAHIIGEKLHLSSWFLNLMISLILLVILLTIKQRFAHRGLFKYV